jgi:hypothetical protein
MRAQQYIPALAAIFSGIAQVFASPAATLSAVVQPQPAADALTLSKQFDLVSRDGHSHHNSHAAPLLQINETEVLMYHAPTPPSYWTIDIDSPDPDVPRYPGLIIVHGLLMSLAFFVTLPMGKCKIQLKVRLNIF